MSTQLASSNHAVGTAAVPHLKLPGAQDAQPRCVSFWQLGTQITGGHWFELYRAAPKTLHENDGFDYVVKLINPHLTGDDAARAVARMGREAVSTDVVEHRSVIPLLDAELDQAPFYLVQPWIAGGSFDKFLAMADTVSLTRMLWIIRQIAEALVAAHEKGRIHLGLEPSHVLVGNGGRVSLIGWSNSHAVDQVVSKREIPLQLARYTAPECFDEGCPAKKASDVYSLALFIYHGFAGHTPFHGATHQEIAAAHQNKDVPSLIRHQPLCPSRLSDLVQWMLNSNPADRPSSREVLDQLISIEIENLSNPAVLSL
ncbi:MAG: serine/threonine-protein kinase [Planctomycetota bacterium]